MSIAVGTGLAIAGVASGVGGLAAAKMQTSAANKAAKIQSQASQNSQAYLQQGMSQIASLYAPYTSIGAQSTNTLGRLLTPPGGSQYASPGPYMTTPGVSMPPGGTQIGMQQYGMPQPPGGMRYPQPQPQQPGMAYPQGGTFAQMYPQMQYAQLRPMQGGYYPQGQ